jgi:hypothetical protein
MPSGETLFARYAFPPNDLGHCGPPGSEVLLAGGSSGMDSFEVDAVGVDGADEGRADEGRAALRARAPRFDGAWPYLRLLAAAAGLDDPLDAGVVSAYWLGGALLDRVDPETFTATVGRTFGGQPGVRERLAGTPEVASAGASHAFHVFVVYPWVGLLGAGADVPRSVLDSCRIRWGTVAEVDGETAGVRSRPLVWDGRALSLGAERVETCRWARGTHAFVRALRPGDQVSLHWDWVCDRLDDAQVVELADRTERQLVSTNSWLTGRVAPARV